MSTWSAHGGGDAPEDVPGALIHAANTLAWTNGNANFCVLICDAPCHGRECNAGLPDRNPGAAPDGKAAMAAIARERIELLMCGLNNSTESMEQAFMQYFREACLKPGMPVDAEVMRAPTSIKDFRASAVRKPTHFVLVLDDSGSMGSWENFFRGIMSFFGFGVSGQPNTPWDALLEAVQAFLGSRIAHQGEVLDEVVTAIQFSDTVSIAYTCVPLEIAHAKRLQLRGGDTNFDKALKQARDVCIAHQATHDHVVVFMSDGNPNEGGSGETEVRALRSTCRGHVQVHTVAFGKGADVKTLAALAAAGGGRAFTAETRDELRDVFVQVAMQDSASAGVLDTFSATMQALLADKLGQEYM